MNSTVCGLYADRDDCSFESEADDKPVTVGRDVGLPGSQARGSTDSTGRPSCERVTRLVSVSLGTKVVVRTVPQSYLRL